MADSPWQLLSNLAAWSLIGLLVLLMGIIVVSVIATAWNALRRKQRPGNHPVFSGKRDDR